MAPKRPRDADGEHETIKKSRKSTKSALPPKKKFYHVRPENLPDGPWKRKLLRERARANAQSQAQRQYSKVRKKYEEEKAREAAAKAKAKRASTIVIAAPTNDDTDQEAKLEEEEEEEEEGDKEEESAPKSGSENQDDDGNAESEPESVSKSHLSATPLDFAPHSEEKPSSKPRKEDAIPEEDSGMHPSRAARLDTKKSFLSKATRIAERKRAEKEARAKERERRVKEREDAVQARNRLRKAKAKAFERGPDGRRKLGRESAVLLEQVKRMVGDKNKVKR